MVDRFIPVIPKKPFLKRQTYDIPDSYTEAYSAQGITNPDEQAILFHLTQFGGFRIRRIPSDMRFNNGFIDSWCKHKSEGGYESFKASLRFLLTFGNIGIKPLERRWNYAVFNEDDMRKCGFTDEEITESYSFLDELNKYYSLLRLDISVPQSGITARDRVYLSGFHGRPFLVKKPFAGGRFFHPGYSYQRMSSSMRPLLTIDGEKTAEFDLTAATLQFLNICFERETSGSLQNSMLSHSDPYQYFLSKLNSEPFLVEYEERPIDRESVKEIVYTAIFSPPNREKSNVNRKLRLIGRRYNYLVLNSHFREFFGALSALKNGNEVPLHMTVFKEEARFAQRILQKGCLEDRLPVLPLHDSFITTFRNSGRLAEILDVVSEEMYGRRLMYKQKY